MHGIPTAATPTSPARLGPAQAATHRLAARKHVLQLGPAGKNVQLAERGAQHQPLPARRHLLRQAAPGALPVAQVQERPEDALGCGRGGDSESAG
jgi:hypothetical protein